MSLSSGRRIIHHYRITFCKGANMGIFMFLSALKATMMKDTE